MSKFSTNLNFYYASTTLHGFSYIAEKKHWIEKIFWLIAIFWSFGCCLFMSHELYIKYKNNPIIVYQPEEAVHVDKIPFPAISICAYSMVNYSYDIFSSLLKNNSFSYPFKISHSSPLIDWSNNIAYIQFDTGLLHVWLDKYTIKSKMVISYLGWCDVFNLIEDDKLFHQNSTAAYFKSIKGTRQLSSNLKLQNFTQKLPLFTPKSELGYTAGLTVNSNPYASWSSGVENFMYLNWEVKVVLHSPFELPDKRHKSFGVNDREVIKIGVGGQIRITDETLLDMDVDDRHCYKPNEHILQYSKTYTSINCLRECESSFILQKCGCVPYYFINNDTSLICSTTQLDCFNREYEEFDEVKCKCYPPCEDVGYEISTQRISSLNAFPEINYSLGITKLTVNFKADSFYPQIRKKYFKMIDWFSFVGGILGLFFGFSFLSGFEIVFHVWMGLFGRNSTEHSKDKMMFMTSRIDKLVKTVVDYLKEFLDNSSIHSCVYIADSKLKIYERLAWLTSFILSITACTLMIIELKERLTIDSISITTNDEYYNISQIPFPAVTIFENYPLRPLISMQKDAGVRYNNFNHKANYANELVQLQIIIESLTHQQPQRAMSTASLRFPHNITNYSHKIVPTIKRFSGMKHPPILIWNRNVEVPRANVFTSRGTGQSFNIAKMHEMFVVDEVSTDFFYSYNDNFEGRRRQRVTQFPWNPEWDSILTPEEMYGSYDYEYEGIAQPIIQQLPWNAIYTEDEILHMYSFREYFVPYIFLHSPYEYPMNFDLNFKNIFEMSGKRSVEVYIIPEIVTSSKDFMELSLRQRNCYLENERKLKFFKVYTQRNCEIECLSDKLLKSCACVPFDVVRDNGTKVCELFDYICVEAVKIEGFEGKEQLNSCNCLQPCNYITYRYELIQFRATGKIVKFKFKNTEFIAMQRIRQFTIFDFLSYIGGLLGLFAGISVLSIFEIFYFCTLRLICEILRVMRGQLRVGCGHNVLIVAPNG